MDELTPQQKEQLKNELTAYAREGATDEQLIAFKNKMIAGFEAQNASTVKKKDGLGQFGGSISGAQSKKQPAIPTGVIESGLPSVSKSGSSSSGNGTDISFMGDTLSGDENNGQQSSEPIFGSIGKAINKVANSRPTDTGDIVVPYKNGVSKKIYKDGYEELITETGEVQPVIKFSGGEIPISKAAIPDGYTKDVIGAKKYAYDLGIKIKAAQSSGDQATLQQVGNELGLIETFNRTTNHESILSSEELKGINSLIPSIGSTAFDKPTPELYSSLIDKQRQIKERIDAENAKKIDEFKPTSADIKAGYAHKLGLKKYEDDPEYKQTEEYIKKVSRGLTKVVDQTASDEASVVNADMRSNYNKLFTSIPGEIKNIVSREHPERLNNLFLTGVESLYWSDRNRYQSIKKRLAQNKTLASVEVAELTSIGASIADADNLQKLKNKEIDQSAFNRNEEDLAKKLDDNFYKRPDILNSSIAKAIGEYHASAKRSTGSRIANTIFGEWEITDKEIDKVPAEWFQKYGIDITRPEAKEQLEEIKRQEGPMILQNAVPKDGLTREFFKGAAQPIRGAIDFFKISNDSNADLVNYKLQGLSRTAEERTKYFNNHYGVLADAFSGFGQFATQYLMMEAGAGMVGVAGKALGAESAVSKSVFDPAAGQAFTSISRGGTAIGNVVSDNSSLMSRLMVPYIQSYDQSYKRGLEVTGDPWKARAYGFVNAAMESISEQMFNNLEFGRKVMNNFRGAHSIDEIVEAIGKGEIKTVIESGLRSSINAVKEGAKGLAMEAFEEVPVSISNFISDAVSNPQQMQDRELFGEAKDAFLAGMVSFSIPSLLGVSSRLYNNAKYTDEDVKNNMLRLASSNRIAVRDAINNQLHSGAIDQKTANEKLQTLNTAAKVAATMPQVYADGTNREMSEKDKVKFLALRVQEKFLLEENKNTDDEAVKISNEETLKSITDQKLAILRTPQVEEPEPEGATKNKEPELSPEDQTLLTELQSKSDEFTKGEGIQFFIDQAVSAPNTFTEKYGEDALSKLLPRSTMKQLASSLTIASKVSEDHPAIPILEAEIARREAILEGRSNQIPISEGEVLRDVESTKKALYDFVSADDFAGIEGGKGKAYQNSKKQNEFFAAFDLIKPEVLKEIQKGPMATGDIIAEAYHKAKEDGSNPKLIKAVEELLGQKPTQSKATEVKNEALTPAEEKTWSELSMQEKWQAAVDNLPQVSDQQTDDEIIELANVNAKTLLSKLNGEKQWNDLSMEEKRALAVQNLPEVKGLPDAEIIAEADKNSKMLLEKLNQQAPPKSENTEQLKNNEDAIQEQSPAEVPIQSEASTSQEVAEGTPQSESQVSTTEGQPQEAVTLPPEITDENRNSIAGALYKLADKILKADITGSGGGAAQANILSIPQQILGRAIQAVAFAIQKGDDFATAIRKGMAELKGQDVEEKDFSDYTAALLAGKKPRVRVTAEDVEDLQEDTDQEKQSEESGEYNFGDKQFEPGNDPISQHQLNERTQNGLKMFGTEKTMQAVWNQAPSDERFMAQVNMLADGREMIGLAQTMFGANIEDYAPKLYAYIRSMPPDDTNKKAILMATFLGELQDALTRRPSDNLRNINSGMSKYYRDYMHVTARNLVAGKLLQLFRDKYMADTFQDVILEAKEAKMKNDVKAAQTETTAKDEDVAAFNDKKSKGKSEKEVNDDVAQQKKDAAKARKEAKERKAANKESYKKSVEQKKKDIENKYGSEDKFWDDLKRDTDDLNDKCK